MQTGVLLFGFCPEASLSARIRSMETGISWPMSDVKRRNRFSSGGADLGEKEGRRREIERSP